jgi:nucleotide-binding universal stress UspA family protein
VRVYADPGDHSADRRGKKETMKQGTKRDKGLIVFGVDSSEGAKAALRFALEEAKFRQATLRAVHSWLFGYIGSVGIEGYGPVAGADLSELRRTAEVALDAVMHEVAPAADGVVIERRVSEGAPATVLVDESRQADLLVVGSRGHGGFAGLLLGSVSQQCAHHGACPVVIVHAKAKAAA